MSTTQNDCRVSVIIPSYNRVDSVAKAIDCVVRQTIKDWEIILVDDHSEQDLRVAIPPNEHRIKFVRLEKRSGAAIARNVGASMAIAPYVAFLDSDDQWNENKLERHLHHIEKESGDFLSFHTLVIDDLGPRRLNPTRMFRPGELVDEFLFVHGQNIQTSAIVLPRKTFAQVRFDENLKRHQDWDLVIRSANLGFRIVHVPEPLGTYISTKNEARISKVPDPRFSERWRDSGVIRSAAAICAFNIRVIAPQYVEIGSRSKSAKLILESARKSRLRAIELLRLSFKALIPTGYQKVTRLLGKSQRRDTR